MKLELNEAFPAELCGNKRKYEADITDSILGQSPWPGCVLPIWAPKTLDTVACTLASLRVTAGRRASELAARVVLWYSYTICVSRHYCSNIGAGPTFQPQALFQQHIFSARPRAQHVNLPHQFHDALVGLFCRNDAYTRHPSLPESAVFILPVGVKVPSCE